MEMAHLDGDYLVTSVSRSLLNLTSHASTPGWTSRAIKPLDRSIPAGVATLSESFFCLILLSILLNSQLMRGGGAWLVRAARTQPVF